MSSLSDLENDSKNLKKKLDLNQNLLDPSGSLDDFAIGDEYEASNNPHNSSDYSNSLKSSSNSFKNDSSLFNDYIKDLNLWIWQCQTWTVFHSALQSQIFSSSAATHDSNTSPSSGNGQQQQGNQPRTNQAGIVLRIPPLRRRIFAGILDYLLINLVYEQFRVGLFELFDLEIPLTTLDFKDVESHFPEDDDNLPDLLSKLLWFYVKTMKHALLFYLFYLIYETLSLVGLRGFHPGGATIGKRITGLRVISCDRIIEDLGNSMIRVSSTNDIGFVKALFRTLAKVFPISNTLQSLNIITSTHYRSLFDYKFGCLVIDAHYYNEHPEAPNGPIMIGRNNGGDRRANNNNPVR